jgi:hypothetical protein
MSNNKFPKCPALMSDGKIFTDYTLPLNDWSSILRYSQLSYINLLESGYILNEKNDIGEIFMLDFNKGSVRYYRRDIEGKIQEIDSVTIEEIMEFNDMPIKSYTEIVSEMQDKFKEYYKNYTRIEEEINKLLKLRREARYQGAVNIELKVNNLLDDMNAITKKYFTFKGKQPMYNKNVNVTTHRETEEQIMLFVKK